MYRWHPLTREHHGVLRKSQISTHFIKDLNYPTHCSQAHILQIRDGNDGDSVKAAESFKQEDDDCDGADSPQNPILLVG